MRRCALLERFCNVRGFPFAVPYSVLDVAFERPEGGQQLEEVSCCEKLFRSRSAARSRSE